MKQTKLVKSVRWLWILAAIVFLSAIITNLLNIQLHTVLYISGAAIFLISSILAIIAANKDKEHLKNVELAKNDERLKNINILSKAKAFDIFTFVFPWIFLFSVIFENLDIIKINKTIVLSVACLFPIVSQLYYFSKFSKKM